MLSKPTSSGCPAIMRRQEQPSTYGPQRTYSGKKSLDSATGEKDPFILNSGKQTNKKRCDVQITFFPF